MQEVSYLLTYLLIVLQMGSILLNTQLAASAADNTAVTVQCGKFMTW